MGIIVFQSGPEKQNTSELFLPQKLTPRNRFTKLSRRVNRKFHGDKWAGLFLLLLLMSYPLHRAYEHITVPDATIFEPQEQLDRGVTPDYWIGVAALFVTAGSLVWTANGIHNQYHHNQQIRSSKYIETWCSEDFIEKIRPILNLADTELENIYEGKSSSIEEGDLETPIMRLKYSG